MEDKLIWQASSTGELTAKQAFLFLQQASPVVPWGKPLWSKFILPRMSLHAWKVMRGTVISDDLLQRRGVALASRCEFCGNSTESLDHIFLHCSFAALVWNHFMYIFEIGLVPNTIAEVFSLGLAMDRSPQLKELWLICFTSILWYIWHARNQIRFESRIFSVAGVCRLVSGHIQASSRLATGHMHNTIRDLCILKSFGACCRSRRIPRMVEVIWHPPSIGWIKINSDGAWKHEEGIGGFGAVFRDYKGHFVGAFASNIDIPSSVAAEVMAVITAIELAWVRDWKHVWLEIDSSTVLDYIRTPSLVPWQLRVRWLNCLYRISTMTFKSSHIFREGNRVADALANHGTSLSEQIWWDVPPPFILSYYERDFLGMPNFRLR